MITQPSPLTAVLFIRTVGETYGDCTIRPPGRGSYSEGVLHCGSQSLPQWSRSNCAWEEGGDRAPMWPTCLLEGGQFALGREIGRQADAGSGYSTSSRALSFPDARPATGSARVAAATRFYGPRPTRRPLRPGGWLVAGPTQRWS
jgi:hypothetical protein